jgi:hypothetical protein
MTTTTTLCTFAALLGGRRRNRTHMYSSVPVAPRETTFERTRCATVAKYSLINLLLLLLWVLWFLTNNRVTNKQARRHKPANRTNAFLCEYVHLCDIAHASKTRHAQHVARSCTPPKHRASCSAVRKALLRLLQWTSNACIVEARFRYRTRIYTDGHFCEQAASEISSVLAADG